MHIVGPSQPVFWEVIKYNPLWHPKVQQLSLLPSLSFLFLFLFSRIKSSNRFNSNTREVEAFSYLPTNLQTLPFLALYVFAYLVDMGHMVAHPSDSPRLPFGEAFQNKDITI